MGNDGLDKGPGQIGDHISCIAACQRRDFQFYAEDDQQNNCHSKGRNVSKENGHRQQDLVKALAQIGCHSA